MKIVFFPIVLYFLLRDRAYKRGRQYGFYGMCSFLLSLMAAVIMGMGVGGPGQTAGIIGLFG